MTRLSQCCEQHHDQYCLEIAEEAQETDHDFDRENNGKHFEATALAQHRIGEHIDRYPAQ